MHLSNSQRIWIQIYRREAVLADAEYRQLLKVASGCRSSLDADWTQPAFDRVMAALETRLFTRVAIGDIPSPIGRSRHIRSEYYWRRKLPRDGEINSRQVKLINDLWTQLAPHLPEHERAPGYFAGIVSKATGRTDVGLSRLSSADAWHVIEALKDRLTRVTSEVPF